MSAIEHHEPPYHVSHRIAVLVSSVQDIQFIDAIGQENRGVETGELCIFTSGVVIYATWKSPEFELRLNGSSGVQVRAWPRRALASVQIDADAEEKTNIDGDWEASIGKGWPGTARVALRYFNQEAVVVLPLAQRRIAKGEHVMKFLPSLMDDLAA